MVTLEASKLFRHLPAGELKPLLASAQEIRFAAGREIFKEGDPGDGVYVVKSGLVVISALIGAGKRHSFSRVLPGDFFGEMAVLDHQPRSACAAAESETEVYFVPRERMVELLTHSAELCMTLLQEISRRKSRIQVHGLCGVDRGSTADRDDRLKRSLFRKRNCVQERFVRRLHADPIVQSVCDAVRIERLQYIPHRRQLS